MNGELDTAEEHCKAALKIAPNALDILDAQIAVKMAQGKSDEAIELAKLLTEKYPNNYFAKMTFGMTHREIAPDRAVSLMEEASLLNPSHFRALYWAGYTLKESEQYDRAINSLKKAAELNPRYWFIHYNLAECQMKMESFKDAAENLGVAIRIMSDWGELYGLRGVCFEELGQEEKAMRDFAKAEELGWSREDSDW